MPYGEHNTKKLRWMKAWQNSRGNTLRLGAPLRLLPSAPIKASALRICRD